MEIKIYLNKYKSMTVMAKASLWALVAGVLQKGLSVLASLFFICLISLPILNTKIFCIT